MRRQNADRGSAALKRVERWRCDGAIEAELRMENIDAAAGKKALRIITARPTSSLAHRPPRPMPASPRGARPKTSRSSVLVGARVPHAASRPSKQLDVFANPNPGRDYLIHMQVPEFTCLCPLTGQPDFAVFSIDLIPDALCVELKSLKMYVWSFRDEGAFHEAVTNRVLEDLATATRPRYLRVTARWGVRGGIFTNIVVEHRKRGWTPAAPVDLPEFDRETSTL
jgi:7-cyano-7-deazaguanine reductase